MSSTNHLHPDVEQLSAAEMRRVQDNNWEHQWQYVFTGRSSVAVAEFSNRVARLPRHHRLTPWQESSYNVPAA